MFNHQNTRGSETDEDREHTLAMKWANSQQAREGETDKESILRLQVDRLNKQNTLKEKDDTLCSLSEWEEWATHVILVSEGNFPGQAWDGGVLTAMLNMAVCLGKWS